MIFSFTYYLTNDIHFRTVVKKRILTEEMSDQMAYNFETKQRPLLMDLTL